ncbi:MAG: CrcB family protein [Candidatus Nitrosotalea sp.]|nr:CrcB family protein [Candidatus Nitrosotalea sp.]
MIIPMKGIEIILLAIGGLAGVFLRYFMTRSTLLLGALPVNILVVNILGSFILGSFAMLSLQWHLDGKYALLVALGFCGGLTTMSSFALESVGYVVGENLAAAPVRFYFSFFTFHLLI